MKNEKYSKKDPTSLCARLLDSAGFPIDDAIRSAWARHTELIRECNRVSSLVSEGDSTRLESVHIVDSLSLLAPILKYRSMDPLLDIGSGGGFPAIPIKILLPDLPMVLVERSVKKVGFLRRLIGALGLTGVEIRHGEYPRVTTDLHPGLITARAVEKPDQIMQAITTSLAPRPKGPVFLCQFSAGVDTLSPMFHVERWEDEWTRMKLRRGTLHLIWRKEEESHPE